MIKSDKWIAARSKVSNYELVVWTHEESDCRYPIPLSEALKEGIDLMMLAQAFEKSDELHFSEQGEPHPLQVWLQAKLGAPINWAGLYYEGEQTYRRSGSLKHLVPVPMIYPFCERSDSTIHFRGKVGKGPSYGLSSYGYDIRLGNKFLVADDRKRPGRASVLDFLTTEDSQPQDHLFREIEADSLELLPGAFVLGVSLEFLNVPDNVLVTCMQKSSVARKGSIAFVTPLEPGWRGYITLELFNATPLPVRLYAGMGIMQLVFHEADESCEVSYADRGGKYMDQGPVPVMSKMG